MAKNIPRVSFPPSESRRPGLLMSAADLQRMATKHAKEDHSKLLLLCTHYGIPAGPRMFYDLSLVLARELYPEPKKRGRKSKWTAPNQGALVVEIERLVKPGDSAHGVRWAAKQLAKREPWKSFLEVIESETTAPNPPEALRNKYFSFKDEKWANTMRKAFKMYEHEGAIADWENQVADSLRNPHPK